MMKTRLLPAIAAFATAVAFATGASATVFNKDYHDVGVWNAYDSENEVYAMKYRSDLGKDGFWLVVSDGPNPKGDGTDYAILYGDIDANKITAYTYNGANNSNSYETGTYLGTFEGAFQDGGIDPRYGYELTMFNLDVSGINSAFGGDWSGVTMGEQVGIWFHQSAGSSFEYGADGELLAYSYTDQMWLDRAFDDVGRIRQSPDCSAGETAPVLYLNSCDPTRLTPPGGSSGGGSVPAPGGLAVILFGMAGIAGLRRRKRA